LLIIFCLAVSLPPFVVQFPVFRTGFLFKFSFSLFPSPRYVPFFFFVFPWILFFFPWGHDSCFFVAKLVPSDLGLFSLRLRSFSRWDFWPHHRFPVFPPLIFPWILPLILYPRGVASGVFLCASFLRLISFLLDGFSYHFRP